MQESAHPISTKEAVDLIQARGVTQFLRLMKSESIEPALELPGIRGAKFWNRTDLAHLIPAAASTPESDVAADPSAASTVPPVDAARSSRSAA